MVSQCCHESVSSRCQGLQVLLGQKGRSYAHPAGVCDRWTSVCLLMAVDVPILADLPEKKNMFSYWQPRKPFKFYKEPLTFICLYKPVFHPVESLASPNGWPLINMHYPRLLFFASSLLNLVSDQLWAASITADASAPSSQRPTVTQAGNGVPLVNIHVSKGSIDFHQYYPGPLSPIPMPPSATTETASPAKAWP